MEAAKSVGFVLTARAENHIRGNPDLEDTIARLKAYEEAGADVLAPASAPTRWGGLRGGVEAGECAGSPADDARRDRRRRRSADKPGRLARAGGGRRGGAAEQIRDAGDFSGLSRQIPVKEWLA